MRRILFLVLMLSSAGAWAEDYYWYRSGSPSIKLSDPVAGCKSQASSNLDYHSHSFNNDGTRMNCQMIRKSDGVTAGYSSVYIRAGDSCPEGTEYNPQTGECEEPNQCLPTEGAMTLHMYQRATRANAYDPWPDTGNDRPVTVCKNECRYSASGYSGEDTCGALINDPLVQACVSPYIGQGVECVDGDSDHQTQLPSFNPGENPDPEPPVDPDDPTDPAVLCNQTPGYTWSGSVCTPIFSDDSPEPNPDQPAPGTPGGGSNGSGSGGEGDGGDGGTGDGGGTGEGGTGGGGGGASQSENPNNVLGTECGQTLQCTADAYQCAILYQSKRSRCDMEKALDFEEQRPQIEALFTGEDFQMDEEEIDIPSFIGQGARFLPATCPAPISIPLSGKTFQLQMEPFCTFASDLGFLIVAFATLASALYIGRAFGGE